MPPSPPPPPPLQHRHSTSITPPPTTESHDFTSLPKPYKVGNKLGVKINEKIYQKSLLSCKFLLLGKLYLPKGSSPISSSSLEDLLSFTLKIKEGLKILHLGLGFYTLKFSSLEVKNKILSLSSCKISCGYFKFFSWRLDFVPSKKFALSHVWVRLHALPLEYWDSHILLSIANGFGVPIAICKNTLVKTHGLYARVLVEVDLSSPLPKDFLIEREGWSFVIKLAYENLPLFCSHCGIIGHNASSCKFIINHTHSGCFSKKGFAANTQFTKITHSPSMLLASKNAKKFIDEEKFFTNSFATVTVETASPPSHAATAFGWQPQSFGARKIEEEINCGVAIVGGTDSSSSLVTAVPVAQVAAMASSRQPPIIDDGLVAAIAKHHATGIVSSSGSDLARDLGIYDRKKFKIKKNHHGGTASAEPLSFSGDFNAPAQVPGELYAAVESNIKGRCTPQGVCIFPPLLDKLIDGEGQQLSVLVAAALSPAPSCNCAQVIPANTSPVHFSRRCSVLSAQSVGLPASCCFSQSACSVGSNPRASLSVQTSSQLDPINLVEFQFVGPRLVKESHNISPRGSKLRSGYCIPFLFNRPKKIIFSSLIGPGFKSVYKAHSGQKFGHLNKMLGPSKIKPSFSPFYSHIGLGSSLGHSSFSQIFSSSTFNSGPSKTFSTQLSFSKFAPSSCTSFGLVFRPS